MDKESFFYLTKQLDKVGELLGTKGIKRTPKTTFCKKMDIIMTVISKGCKTKNEIVDNLLKNFELHHLWEIVHVVSSCDCCRWCSKKLGREIGNCKCACFSIWEVFVLALEKEAYDRLAKIENRPTFDEILEFKQNINVSNN